MDRRHTDQTPAPAPDADRIAELTAGLRRLARGLVRSEADADDLVQDAWVAALRSPPDDSVRLGGWLRRTLRNLAVDRRLAAARRARHEAQAAGPAGGSDPGLEQIEILQRLLTEVGSLEEPFRTAVRLRFLEGEPPRRIAKQLGVPVTTVHSRIQRGLARLRERLDAQSGGNRKAWLGALLPLARPEGALLGAAAMTGLVVLMKTQVLALVAVCVLGGGGAAVWWLAQGEGPAQSAAGTAPGDAAPDARTAELPGAAPEGIERAPVVTAEQPDEERSAALAWVRGRCVDEATGAPLAGVLAEFHGRDSNAQLVALHADAPPWSDPEPVETDADGRFEIAFVPHPANQHSLELGLEGYSPRTGRWGRFEPGQVENLGEIRMLRGYEIEGLVLGKDDLPRKGVSVGIHDLPLPIRPDMAANDARAGVSGADGRFSVSTLLPPGTWPLRLYRGGYLVGPRSVTVPLSEPLIVHVAELQAVRGRVIDTEGQPMKRVYVEGESADGRYLSASWTNDEGRFAIRQRQPDDGPPVQLSVNDVHRGHRIPRTVVETETTWGQDGVELRVERTGQLDVRVVDDETGEPIEGFALRLYPDNGRGGTIQDVRSGGTHPRGRVQVWGLEKGDNVLVVVPQDPRWLQSTRQKIAYDGEPLEAPVEVRLRQSVPIPARVLDAAGEQIANAQVDLIDPGVGQDEELTVDSSIYDRSWILQSPSTISISRKPNRIDRRSTDASGRCTLFHDPRFAGQVALLVNKKGYRAELVWVDPVSVDEEVVIRLSPAGDVRGTLAMGLAGYEHAHPELVLVREGEGAVFDSPRATPDHEGGFVFEGVQPGRYDLRFGLRHTFRWGGSGSGGTIGWREPLRSALEVSGNADLELGTIAVDPRPAFVSGKVSVGGHTPEAARLWFVAADDSRWTGFLGAFAVSAEGRFEVSDLPPGRWRPFVAVGCGDYGCTSWSRAADVLEVRPGERARVAIEVPRRVVRVRVVDEDDRPVGAVTVNVSPQRSFGGARSLEQTTDATGCFLLDPAPDVPLVFRVARASQQEWRGVAKVDVVPPDTAEPVEVTLRVTSQ